MASLTSTAASSHSIQSSVKHLDKDLWVALFALPGCFIRVLLVRFELFIISRGGASTIVAFSGFFFANTIGCMVMSFAVNNKHRFDSGPVMIDETVTALTL